MQSFILLGLPQVSEEKAEKLCKYTTAKLQKKALDIGCTHDWTCSLLNQQEGVGLAACTDEECKWVHKNQIMSALHNQHLDSFHLLRTCDPSYGTKKAKKDFFLLLGESITRMSAIKREYSILQDMFDRCFAPLISNLFMDYICDFYESFCFEAEDHEKRSDYLLQWKEEMQLPKGKEMWMVMVDEKQYWGTWPDYESSTIRSVQVLSEKEFIQEGLYPPGDGFHFDPFTISRCWFLLGSLDEKEACQLAFAVIGSLFVTNKIAENAFNPGFLHIGWAMEKKNEWNHLDLPNAWQIRIFQEKQDAVFSKKLENGWNMTCSGSTAKLLAHIS